MYDIVALGESLIDFTPSGVNELGISLFGCNPGGAPANVLAMAGKLGSKTAFIGKVGDDGFGRFLKSTMDDAGIDTSGLLFSGRYPTTLAFVQLTESGDRSFSFYRECNADVMLETAELPRALLEGCKTFHFGSVSLSAQPARDATFAAAKLAKAAGAIISYDPNYRPLLWADKQEALIQMKAGLLLADLVKVSEEELELLTGTADLKAGADILASQGATLVIVTLGPKGAFYRTKLASGLLPTFDVKTVDTTGAGDSFWGALLHRLCGKTVGEIGGLSDETLVEFLTFANAAGSLTTTKKGAIPAMPTQAEIVACMKEIPTLG